MEGDGERSGKQNTWRGGLNKLMYNFLFLLTISVNSSFGLREIVGVSSSSCLVGDIVAISFLPLLLSF